MTTPIGSVAQSSREQACPPPQRTGRGFMPPALVTIFSCGCLLQSGSEAREHVEKILGVAGVRVLLPQPGQDRHRQLGEVLERQIIEPGAARPAGGRVEPIAQKPAPLPINTRSRRFNAGFQR